MIVRSFVGLHFLSNEANSHSVCPHRVVCAAVSAPGQPTFAAYSAYFETGGAMGSGNIDMFRSILHHKLSHDLPVVIGGDFQTSPLDWQSTAWPALGQLQVVSGSMSEATYVHPSSCSVLDFSLCPTGSLTASRRLEQ